MIEPQAPTPVPEPGRSWQKITAVVASFVLAVGLAVTITLLATDDGDSGPSGSPATTTPGVASSSTAPSSTTAPPASTAPGEPQFGFLPLWPFAGTEDAAAWQREYRAGGHQPWHLDVGETALSFTRGHLGYTDIDRVTSSDIQANQAWVGVGFALLDGGNATAAVLHLAKIGTGADAPWEVVGSRDTTLTLTTPGYGSAVSSPVRVGGRVSGVDENLVVQVRGREGNQVGLSAGLPAGGEDTPWSTDVAFDGGARGVLTIAVATGGHVTGVERFAITGVRVR